MSKIKTQDICISSRDRLSSSPSTSDFIVQLPEQVLNVCQVELIDVQLPNVFYNITTNNQILTWVYNDGSDHTLTYTIPAGCYDINTLVTKIQAGMNGAGDANTYSVTYNNEQFTVTFTRTGGSATFQLKCSLTTGPWYELGFPYTDTALDASPKTSPNVVNLASVYHLGLSVSPLLALAQTSSGNYVNWFLSVDTAGGVVINQPVNSEYMQTSFIYTQSCLTQLHIKLDYANTSSRGALNLNGADWEFILRVYYKDC